MRLRNRPRRADFGIKEMDTFEKKLNPPLSSLEIAKTEGRNIVRFTRYVLKTKPLYGKNQNCTSKLR